jgi:hypothetical protein
MKTLITFLTSTIILLNAVTAQLSENFDQSIPSMSPNCWIMNGIDYTTAPGDVINGTGSAYTNPPTSSSSIRSITTPFLNITPGTFTISFKYKISAKIAGNATRTIEIGLVDKAGVFTSLQLISMDKNTVTTVLTHAGTYSAPAGVYRVQLNIGGATGDGNSRVILDDLAVSAGLNNTSGTCTPTAVANNDTYPGPSNTVISGNVLTNDLIPADGDTYSASLVAAPSSGTLVLNPNGTFSYSPAALFISGTITFSYKIIESGASPATSNTATVTLSYSIMAILPMKLISFNAVVEGSIVKISWKVDDNQTGNYFELEKSADGKHFTSINKVFVQPGTGVKNYASGDQLSSGDVYYRIKMVNRDLTISYSKVVVLKNGDSPAEVQIFNNPASSTLNISFERGKESNSTISVYSISGVKVYEYKLITTKGVNKVSIPVQSLQHGTYVLVIDSVQSKKFIKG